MSANVTVINKGDAFKGKFDGKVYEFPNDEPVTIPTLAARFIFGFGGSDVDRARVLVRNGWQKVGNPTAPDGPLAAQKRLASFVFKAAPDDQLPPKPVAKVLKPMVKVIEKKTEPEAKSEAPAVEGLPLKSRGSQITLPGRTAPLAPSAAR